MKCPICNGRGSVYNALGNFYEDCGHCQGTGKVRAIGEPMTNEEYIHSLNTEGLAGLLYEYRYDNATPQQRLWLAENEKYCNKCIAEWLKELHTGGEP